MPRKAITREQGLREGWFLPNERDGYCYCGCGRLAPIASYSAKAWGWVKGEAKRYAKGHSNPFPSGEENFMYERTRDLNPNWRGGRWSRPDGYIGIRAPDHPYATNGYVLEHRLVIEDSIGRFLLPEEEVDHCNHIRSDNRLENLRLFSSKSAHMKHHANEGKMKDGLVSVLLFLLRASDV